MLGEGTPIIFVTFVMAIVGYVGLTGVVVLTLRGPVPVFLWRGVALIIFAHVVMVWAFRYGWVFDLAVRNGYAGFVIFHVAMLAIVVSTFCREDLAKKLIHISFLIVTMGAIGASFRYDVVAIYRIPVMVCGLVGGISLIRFYVVQRRFLET